jgi:hypothetical protein
MSGIFEPVIDAVGETFTGLGGCGAQSPDLEGAMLANGCVKINDVAPMQSPSLVAELAARPVTLKMGR